MKTIYLLPIILISLLLPSCAGDDDPGSGQESGKNVKVNLTLMSRATTGTAQPGEDEKAELINNYRIIFVGSDNAVKATIDRPADKTEAVNLENFQVELPADTYTIYAFANMTADYDNYTSAATIENKTWSKLPTYEAKDLVPMSGKLENVVINHTVSRNIVVEVVRLVAKLEFEFTNVMSSAVSINSITMTSALNAFKDQPDATGGHVKLLPKYSTLNGPIGAPETEAPDLPDDIECRDWTLHLPTPLAIAKDASVSLKRYLFETTAAAHPTGHYVVKLSLTRDGETNPRTITALAYELTSINRNDHIIIPITLIDYNLGLDVRFYPPIGGYPAVITEEKDDEFYAKFGSSGKFIIKTNLINSATGEEIPPADYDVTVTVSEDDKKLFIENDIDYTPAFNETTREIIGSIATDKTGQAVIRLDLEVTPHTTPDTGTTPTSYTFTRMIYIQR